MTINEHLTEFAGKPVKDWEQGAKDFDPTGIAYRINVTFEAQEAERIAWERVMRKPTTWIDKFRAFMARVGVGKLREGGPTDQLDEEKFAVLEKEAKKHITWADKFRVFLTQPGVEKLDALIVGPWGGMGPPNSDDASDVVIALVEARTALPNLQALFFGDIVMEESEISWIELTNILPLLQAYPQLETFAVRGSIHLVIGKLEHSGLKSLTIQSGGLPLTVLKDVLQANLPNLERLELWLGVRDYGWDGTVDDLKPLFAGEIFPKLHYLGLRDSQIADEIAVAVADAPILERIKVLDLSLGTLTDEGAEALLKSPTVRRLEKLDLHHHYCSNEVMEQLHKLGNVDASDQKQASMFDDGAHRYVAVSE